MWTLTDKKGFTLIELIIVVVILGILITLALPRVLDSVRNSRINRQVSNVISVDKAINRIYAETGKWPADQGTIEKALNFKFDEIYVDPYTYPGDAATEMDLRVNIPNGTLPNDFASKPNFTLDGSSTTTVLYTIKVQ